MEWYVKMGATAYWSMFIQYKIILRKTFHDKSIYFTRKLK